MKCPFCGEENIAGVDNCESCGEDLTAFDGVRPKDSLEYSMVKESIESVAKCQPLQVTVDTNIHEVAEGLTHENRCGLVMDGRRLVGVVTVRDILQKAILKGLDLKNTAVKEIMTPNPDTLTYEDKIVHALNKMAIGGYRHVPILREDKTYNVISVRDIIAYLTQKFPKLVQST